MSQRIKVLEVDLNVRTLGCPHSFVDFITLLSEMNLLEIVHHYDLTDRPEGHKIRFRVRPPFGTDPNEWLESNKRRLKRHDITAEVKMLARVTNPTTKPISRQRARHNGY